MQTGRTTKARNRDGGEDGKEDGESRLNLLCTFTATATRSTLHCKLHLIARDATDLVRRIVGGSAESLILFEEAPKEIIAHG
jgi:hypothetical protein